MDQFRQTARPKKLSRMEASPESSSLAIACLMYIIPWVAGQHASTMCEPLGLSDRVTKEPFRMFMRMRLFGVVVWGDWRYAWIRWEACGCCDRPTIVWGGWARILE